MSTSKSEVSSNAIPRGWAMSTLAEATRLSRARGQPSEFGNADFVGLEHIEAQTTRLIGCAPAASMRSSGVTFRKGDVLYGRMRPYLNKVWVADRSGLCSGEFIVFGADGALGGPFLQYRLNAQDFVTFADHTTSGDRPRADFADLGRFPVLVPPASEQRRIEERIADLLADLNAGVAALERVKRNLVRYRAAVLHAAVTGQLTAAWRKRNGPPSETGQQLLERILIERRRIWEERTLAKYRADGKQPPKGWKERYAEPSPPVTPGDESPRPVLPNGWCWATVDQCADVQGGLQKSPARTPVRNHFPYLRVANVLRGRLDLDDLHRFELEPKELEKLRLVQGDLLIVEGNGSVTEIGRSALWGGEIFDCVHQNHIIRVRFMPGATPVYMDAFVNSPLGQSYMRSVASSTSGLHTLSVGKVRSIEFPLPPMAEQCAIVEAVNEKLSQINALETEVTRGLVRTGRLRQAILKAAFEGRLVPQDPSDEPAAVLLERVRAVAAQPATKKPRKKSTPKTITT